MGLHAVWAIAINTFRETVRDKVLYAFVIFALFLTLAGILLGSLSITQTPRVLEDIGMFTISTIGGVIAIFVGTNLVYKELDKRTIYLIFTKPIRRWQFILGKFLGLALCLLAVTIMMGAFLLGTAYFNGERNLMALVGSLGLLYVELLLVNALATFFSTFATPLMSMIFTLGLWISAHLSQSLLALGNMSTSPFVKNLFTGIYHVLPDLSRLTQVRFGIIAAAENAPRFSTESIILIMAYVFAYIVILLSFATVVTERREFS